ncbi:MAG TPA: glycine dehydrogenase, partial [Pyrodictium sp.]|nr:glycine dehydrogenase [Pyrodictium sp.]
MIHPWIPSANKDERKYMLKKIGVSTPLDLYRDVPSNLLLDKPPEIGFGKILSEFEIRRILESYLRKNKTFLDPPPFMGGGLCFHVVPAAVKY